MLKTLTFVAAGATVLATGLWAQEETPDHRLRSAASVFHEMLGAPESIKSKSTAMRCRCHSKVDDGLGLSAPFNTYDSPAQPYPIS